MTSGKSEAQPLRLYPPRPRESINPLSISQYSGFLAQYKYDDVRVTLHFLPGGEIEVFNRYRVPVRVYELSLSALKGLRMLELPVESYHVLDGGILRKPITDGSRPIILWDVLVYRGQYLVGTTYKMRYSLLSRICGAPSRFEAWTGHKLGLEVHGPVWLAPVFQENLVRLYESVKDTPEVEGLILKDPNGRLERGLVEENNGAWQIRVRKPSGRYVY